MRRSTLTASKLGAWLLLAGSLLLGSPGSAQTDANFDHSTTRFPLTGSHRREPCEACHLEGLFQGTPDRCEQCHDGSGLRAETAKPGNHVTSSNRCDDCHDTVLWSRVVFDHAGVTGRCETCHDGITATGKPMDHLATTAGCELCHSTRAWSPARFDHSTVTGSCASCHDGVTATGKDMDHLTTNSDCGLCHSTRAWSPATFDHSTVTGPCSSCHDGVTATGTDAGHFDTTLECDACHNTVDWQPAVFRHTSANYPGDHRQALTCVQCHTTNRESVPWPSPGYAPDCAACHEGDFRPDPHKKVDSPTLFYTVGELRDCTGACHQYTDATFTTIQQTRSGEHRVSDGGF